jgi:hypothetical protein
MMGGTIDTADVTAAVPCRPTPVYPWSGGQARTDDRTPPPNTDEHRPVRNRALVWSVFAVVFVECLYALWTAWRGYFLQDDFLDLQRVRQLGFGGRLFEHPVFGHFIPGFTFVDYLLSLIVPYQWWVIVLIDVLLFALSLILLHRLLTTLFGSSWLGVVLVAIAGASFSLVPSFVWWSTALEYLVAIPATLLACLFHVRYLRTGRLRHAVFGTISIAVGFAFYDGLFVSVVFIVLMTVLFWPAGPGVRGAFETLAVHSRAWVCYAVPVVLELGWRLNHPGLYPNPGSASIGQTLGFIGLSWTQTVIPLTFGVDAWLLPTHADRVLAGLLGQVAFIAFFVFTVARRRSAWRAWVLFGCTFFVGAALVGVTRAGTYGAGDASDVKYVALDAFFLVIAAGFALAPVRTISTAESEGSRRTLRTARSAWFPVLVGFTLLAVVLAYGAALVFDQNRDHESVGSHASRQFFATFGTSWATRTSPTNSSFLWDTEINPVIVTRAWFPYDTAAVTVGRLYPQIQFDKWGGTGFLLRANGSVVRATAVTQANGLISQRTGCADPHHPAGKIVIDLDHRLTAAEGWFGLISYRSATGAVATQSDRTTVDFPKGEGTLIAALPPGPLGRVELRLQPRSSICVTGLKVVLPEPAGSHPQGALSP